MFSFQLAGLPASPFERFFSLSAEALAPLGIQRVVATSSPGFPCRISLSDAEKGEELLLLAYEHQPAHSPYRASGPIFVRIGARQRILEPGVVPDCVRVRQISLRAYDVADMMIGAEVCAGDSVGAEIARQFDDPRVSYIHLHNAKRGCFSCRVERVAEDVGHH
jgi:uncharacterized protein DUF1203